MKVLILSPTMINFDQKLKLGFEHNNCEVLHYDVSREINKLRGRIHNHIGKVPFWLRSRWYNYFIGRMNDKQLAKFDEFQPDLVIAYNGMLLHPQTVKTMQKSAKVCFFLGDSPFFTHQNDYYLPALMQADHILCPDTYWEKQLRGMGHDNVHFFLMGSNPQINYHRQVSAEELENWGSDLVFVGISYLSVAGYKRAHFLNQFTGLDIKIYTGTGMKRWYASFPELEKKVTHPAKRFSDEELNTILNCCRIYPVDANPGLLNGVHMRIFDCIATGILPLAEYRIDVKTVFGDAGLPIIDNYKKAASIAEYYLSHERERLDIISELQSVVNKSYAPHIAVQNLLQVVKL